MTTVAASVRDGAAGTATPQTACCCSTARRRDIQGKQNGGL